MSPSAAKPPIHGRDHRIGGADPIPYTEWARAYFRAGVAGDVAQTIGSHVSAAVQFMHFQTSNRSVFETVSNALGNPSPSPSDRTLRVKKRGLFHTSLWASWDQATTFARSVSITHSPQDFTSGDQYTSPANNTIIGTTPVGGLTIYTSQERLIYTEADPNITGFQAIGVSATNWDPSTDHDLRFCELYVAWWPVLNLAETVY